MINSVFKGEKQSGGFMPRDVKPGHRAVLMETLHC